MDKRRHELVIQDDLWKGLSVFILNKQGEYKKGDISKWVNIAISNLIQGFNTHTHGTQNENRYQIPVGRLKVKNLMLDICKQHQLDISEVPLARDKTILTKHLRQIIQDVTGHHDNRTIDKHIKDLIKYEYIKDAGFLGSYLVLDTGTDIEYIERIQDLQRQDERNQQLEATI